MTFPYQCLVALDSPTAESKKWTLYGASGSRIVIQCSSGAKSEWLQEDDQDPQANEVLEPPGKRIKLSSTPKERTPNFTHLILSYDGKYLVGVTGEDKCIRVFQIESQAQVKQVSERCMARRPSSIVLTRDNSTILCADKFGDVYALPLLPLPNDIQLATPVKPAPETINDQLEGKDFTPAATVLTVHSGRNRRTLEEQLKQKAKGPPKPREAITFKNDLLFGHVSMLTDIIIAQVDKRSYIITADRDEHVRISRGPPQAHIIEGFCYGHGEFVSRLCLTRTGELVSGGGDSDLFVWDWQKYRLLERLPLRTVVLKHLETRADLGLFAQSSDTFKVAVSGLWAVPDNTDRILVACEGLPAVLSLIVGAGATDGVAIPLEGNPLDVAFIHTSQAHCTMVVSVDNIHKPGSTTEFRGAKDIPRLQCFSLNNDGEWREDTSTKQALEWFAQQGPDNHDKRTVGEDAIDEKLRVGSADDKALRDILYHVENLRKRPGAED